MKDLRFRYDENNIDSMLNQMEHEFKAVSKYTREWIKPFFASRVKRTYPFDLDRVVTTKRGNKWHLHLFAQNEDQMKDMNHAMLYTYMEYTCKHGRGFLLVQYMDNHYIVFDFAPHAIERYRQRYLAARNINLTWEGQVDSIIKNSMYHNLNLDDHLAVMMIEQGAFTGDYIGGAWLQLKTFVAYENAFSNQKQVLDIIRGDIERTKQKMKEGQINYDNIEYRYDVPDIHKVITRQMIHKEDMYREKAEKRNEQYMQSIK